MSWRSCWNAFGGLVLLATTSWTVRLDLATENGYQWRLTSSNGSFGELAGQVPGGVYSDLARASVLDAGDPLYRFNDQTYRWVGHLNWTYRLRFDVDRSILDDNAAVDLVMDGVDTAAEIRLNDQILGRTENMFVRLRFDVRNLLKVSDNELGVAFESPVAYASRRFVEQSADHEVPPRCVPDAYRGECHANHIRKMQAAFAWDWGPAFPSVGLWRSVYLTTYRSLTLRDVAVATSRDADAWRLDLRLHCEKADAGGAPPTGVWSVRLTDADGRSLLEARRRSKIHSHDHREAYSGTDFGFVGDAGRDANREVTVELQFFVDALEIKPWMPYGYGDATLYHLDVSYAEDPSLPDEFAFTKRVDIGFRTVELVQDELPTGGRAYYVRVNDVAVFLKGSNWIPADVRPEVVTEEYVHQLLLDCRHAHMNALRVWGGGVYESDFFYQTADRLGILIWQDLMFACSMYPTSEWFLRSVAAEVRQNVRRLQHHPSLLLWAGNNENEAALRGNWYGTVRNFSLFRQEYVQLYVDTIRPLLLDEDPTRPYVVSSPSNGLKSEEDGFIALNPYSDLYGDVHHYNYYANAWNWTTYPRPRMATEYGFQSLPSAHAWNEAADPFQDDDWSYQGQLLDSRQHHPLGNIEMDLQIQLRLGPPRTHLGSRQELLDRMYLTQMHQAQAIKTETEHYRRHRYLVDANGAGLTMAALYWQLNDVWQAPSWASIELGGRWKPLHYAAARFFAPLALLLVELEDGRVAAYGHCDRAADAPTAGNLTITVQSWDQLQPRLQIQVPLPAQWTPGVALWSEPLGELLQRTGCQRETCFVAGALPSAPDNELYLTSFPAVTNLAVPAAAVRIAAVGPVYASPRSPWTVDVTLATDQVVAFVWLDTSDDRQGVFSDNAFLMRQPERTVSFYARDEIADPQAFRDRITILHLAQIIRQIS